MPPRAAEPADAFVLDARERVARRGVGVARWRLDANEHLVEDDVVEDADRRFLAQAIGEAACQTAAALHEIGEAASAERAQRGVDREAAGPARRLRNPVRGSSADRVR